MGKHIRILTIQFNTEISSKEIPLFRGAVLKALGDKANLLYHNHTGEQTYRYSYPLIQYKRIRGKAAMVCINEGADVIGQFLTNMPSNMVLGDRDVNLTIEKVIPARILVQTWQSTFCYHVSRWLPLNTKNYIKYQTLEGVAEKVLLLESILKGNLLSMLKGLGIHLESELVLKIIDLSSEHVIYNKDVAMMSFNATFTTNLSIPHFIGVGKNASLGCGMVYEVRKNDLLKEENKD